MPRAASTTADPLARLRSLPKAGPPNDDVSQVRGNCSDEHKQLNMNAWAFYAPSGTAVFGSEQARQLKLVEANIRKRRVGPPNSSDPDGYEAETIYEIEVKEGADDLVATAPYSWTHIDIWTRDAQCERNNGGSLHNAFV